MVRFCDVRMSGMLLYKDCFQHDQFDTGGKKLPLTTYDIDSTGVVSFTQSGGRDLTTQQLYNYYSIES